LHMTHLESEIPRPFALTHWKLCDEILTLTIFNQLLTNSFSPFALCRFDAP
jgi:hypothetical protein